MAPKPGKKTKTEKSSLLSFLKANQGLFSILFVIAVALISSRFLKNNLDETSEQNYKSDENLNIPKYWHVCYSNWNDNGHLRTMDRVFDRLGFEFVNASEGDDWDVLWGFEYPFDQGSDKESDLFDPILDNPLKFHQRINHIPGNGHLTSKRRMTTENRDLKFVMPTFDGESKKEFEEYVQKNPEKKFVQKHIYDRGVEIIEKEKIDFNVKDKIYQVFMDKPMLIDDRAFDMGIYVLISSINPLRIYRYDAEMLMRFCPEPYYPFNASNVNQYVIFESHLQYDMLPSFKKYNEKLGYSLKHIYENYLREKGLEPAKMWKQVDEIIATVITRSENKFIHWTDKTIGASTHHFFELVRFDFIIDADFNVFLMEINMSPNITPESPKFEKNAIVREKMVNEVLNLVGAANYFDIMTRYNSKPMEMISNPSDIAVNLESCIKNNCQESCFKPECELCLNCLKSEQIADFRESFREHSRRGGFKRVFPSKSQPTAQNLSPRSEKVAKWLEAKCKIDESWC